ncbi:MAG: DUF4386 family protein [Actinobacteria bacterium]|nr:DUF4386 family protein [Actinomycetota bacterium]
MRSVLRGEVGSRIGGWASLLLAGTFIVGIAMFATVLRDYATEALSAAEGVSFVVDHRAALHVWYVVTLIVFGLALVPLVLALHERLSSAGSGWVKVSTALGLIWSGLVLAAGMIANTGVGAIADLADRDAALAGALWSSLEAVQNGMGGGNEVVGGTWVLLVSAVALRSGLLSRWIALLGLASGVSGLVTVVPPLEPVGLVFGLGLIVWFAGVGWSLLRRPGVQRATSVATVSDPIAT